MSAAPDTPLAAALLDSRARWQDFALLAADLLFETDAGGRLVFLAPEAPLGHAAAALVGQHAGALLAEGETADPFDPARPPRGLRAWLRRADGGLACLEFNALPRGGGLRGVARDVTAEERRAESTARALRRLTALARLLGAAQRGGTEGGAAGPAVPGLLEGILHALGCSGAALLRAGVEGWRIVALVGAAGPLPQQGAGAELPLRQGPLALVPAAAGLALAAWRDPAPEEEDLGTLAALAPSVAALQMAAERQGELDRAARTDPLTGLLNRRGFAEALARARAARPEGALAYLDMDGLKMLNDRHGHAAGDTAIRALAARLTAALGPGDLAARLGGDEFALWLDGAGLEAARARCIPLCAPGPLPGLPDAGPGAVAASFGLAAADAFEAAETLVARADAAMYRRKLARRAA